MTSKLKNIHYLQGSWASRRGYIQKIKKKMGEYELSIFDETYSYNYVEQYIMENSCFDSSRLIILNNWPGTIGSKSQSVTSVINKFVKILPDIPEKCILIFNNCKTKSKKFISAIEKYGCFYDFGSSIKLTQARKKIKQFFLSKKKQIDDNTVNFLIESFNSQKNEVDVDQLYISLKKIENYIGTSQNIKESDIKDCCSHSIDYVVWNLFNAFDDKDLDKSLKMMEVGTNPTKNLERDAIGMLTIFKWRYNLIYLIKNAKNKGMKNDDIKNHINSMVKLKQKGVGNKIIMEEEDRAMYSPQMINTILNTYYSKKSIIDRYEENELLLILTVLNELPIKIRWGASEAEIRVLLRLLCLVMCRRITKMSQISFALYKDPERLYYE